MDEGAALEMLCARKRTGGSNPPLSAFLGQRTFFVGEMAERLKAAVSKTAVGVTSPGVRIPLSPLRVAG